jgi:uncharacterized protein (AIM24 family)
MRSDLFAPDHQETAAKQPGMVLQNSKMLKIALAGEVLARQGSMVAYQGEVQFKALGSGGVGKFLKQKLTGEGIPLMKASGEGDVFLADLSADVHLIDLEGPDDALTVNGRNVLAFEPTLSYADPQAAVAWSAGLQTGFHRADQLGLGMLLGRSTGEAFPMSFAGRGFVIVQPSEELPVSVLSGSGNQSGSGGLFGDLMGR